MSVPITLNSRTFVRNITPNSYPAGTRAGHDWGTPGGVFDNTDPRNTVYWGPPRPVNDDADFRMEPGETPANAIRRLKIAGYIGLYAVRPATARQKQEPREDTHRRPNLLETLAAQARVRRENTPLTVLRGEREGVRPSRLDRRAEDRRERHAELLAGEPPRIPTVAGYDIADHGISDEDTFDTLADDPQEQSEEIDYIRTEVRDMISGNPGSHLIAGNLVVGAGIPEAKPQPEPEELKPLSAMTDDEPEPVTEDEDAPVGGWGQISKFEGGGQVAPPSPPPMEAPPEIIAPAPLMIEATPAPTTGKGIAGRGRRRKNTDTSE